ncbi:hypothetical protein Tco_1468279 [Tanacetum coccineum]
MKHILKTLSTMHYDIVDRVMRPLALKQTRRPRSDRGKACHSVSSSSSHHHGTSSHQHDDDDDVETSRATLFPSDPSYIPQVQEKNTSSQLKKYYTLLLDLGDLFSLPKEFVDIVKKLRVSAEEWSNGEEEGSLLLMAMRLLVLISPKWSAKTSPRGDILLGSAELQEIKTTKTRKAKEGVCLWKHLLLQLWCHVMVLVDMTGSDQLRKGL